MAISVSTVFTSLGKLLASFANLISYGAATAPIGGYKFTVTAVTTAPTAGATYTNNGVTFTVMADVKAAGTTVAMSGSGAPAASGTLTKATGTGDATLTFSAVTQYSNWGASGAVIKSQSTMTTDILTRLEGAGLTTLIPFQSWQSTFIGIDQQALQSQKSVLAALIQQVIITYVNNDVPQQSPTSFTQAIQELIRQMQQQSENVAVATVSSTITVGSSNTGNATVYASLYDENGLLLENAIAETLTLKCTQDQFNGGTAGSEVVTLVSPAAAASNFSYLWPGGSGLSTQLTVVDPTQGYGSGGNQVGGGSTSVGAFKAWTGSIPNGWTIDVDGTNISDGTSAAYAGLAHCLAITGNTAGTNLNTALYQSFANGGITTGSTVTILPNTVYHFYAKVKADVVPAAGVLQFSLTDGSGTVINSNAAVANTITSTISGFGGTTYQTVTGYFVTPTIMPTNVRLRIKASTKITTGSIVYVDYMALAEPATQGYGGLYAGGPYVSIFRGSVDLIQWVSYTIGDYWTDLIANNYGAASSPYPLSFNSLLNQTCGMAQLGFILPTSGSGTESNSLIQ